MTIIDSCSARPILDSRGDVTIEVVLASGRTRGSASAPGGASTGIHEVPAFPPDGVDAALEIFKHKVAPRLKGMDAEDQAQIDATLHEIDGSGNLSNIGGSLSISTSLAAAKLAAAASDLPLFRYLNPRPPEHMPRPLGNVIGGGKHAIGGTDIQEFLCLASGEDSWKNVRANAAVYKAMGKKLSDKFPGKPLGKGDEGAWVTSLSNTEALQTLASICKEMTERFGFPCRPSLDIAATSLFKRNMYLYKEGKKTPEQQITFVEELVDKFGLAIVEDPLQEEDFSGFAELTRRVGGKCLVVGDDLYVTKVERLKRGIAEKASNAILIKPNQVGTLSDTKAAVDLARKEGITTVVSHRSGETTDATIAHLAVAFGSYAIKTGIVGGERIAKLNELARIQSQIRGE
jgi:enolase